MSEQKTKKKQPTEFGYIKDNKVYRAAFLDYPDLEIGEVRETEEKSLEYFGNRYKVLEGKIDELEKSVLDAVNKGSYLMKLLHMKDKMADYKGIGDFVELINRLDKMEESLQDNIANNRIKNLEIKEPLLKKAETLSNSTDWKDTAEKMKELRANWVRTGAVLEDKQAEYEERFHLAVNGFFEAKRAFSEARKLLLASRSKKYRDLINEVRNLSDETDKEKIYARLKEIKEEWEKVGELPRKMMSALEGKLSRSVQFLKGDKRPRRRIGEARPYQNQRSNSGVRPGFNQNRSRPSNSNSSRSDSRNSNMSEAEMIAAKTRLLNAALRLKEMPLEKSIPLAKELQEKWLQSGRSTSMDVRNIYNKFRQAIATVFEIRGLEIEIKKRYPVFSAKSLTEQKIIRIAIMRELIRNDKTEVKMFEDNLIQSGAMESESQENKTLVNQLKGQKYRVKIKELLLQDIELQ